VGAERCFYFHFLLEAAAVLTRRTDHIPFAISRSLNF
jgi:hypothetical protein